jgi:hypothetical protein
VQVEASDVIVSGLLPPGMEVYARTVAALLLDDVQLARLRGGACAIATRYSLETMAGNYAGGVTACR